MKTFIEKRKHIRKSLNSRIDFIILSYNSSELNRIKSFGTIVDISEGGIGLFTRYPLEPGHVIEWDDETEKGNLHIALVKWSQNTEGDIRVGLAFI
jgi:hypothetical protein